MFNKLNSKLSRCHLCGFPSQSLDFRQWLKTMFSTMRKSSLWSCSWNEYGFFTFTVRSIRKNKLRFNACFPQQPRKFLLKGFSANIRLIKLTSNFIRMMKTKQLITNWSTVYQGRRWSKELEKLKNRRKTSTTKVIAYFHHIFSSSKFRRKHTKWSQIEFSLLSE